MDLVNELLRILETPGTDDHIKIAEARGVLHQFVDDMHVVHGQLARSADTIALEAAKAINEVNTGAHEQEEHSQQS